MFILATIIILILCSEYYLDCEVEDVIVYLRGRILSLHHHFGQLAVEKTR